MERHPTRLELLGYAESLIGGRPISAHLGAHVARCPACAAEVDAMRATLRVAAAGSPIEPSREFTAQVLLAAKQERTHRQRHRSRVRSLLRVSRGLGYAAALVVLSAVWFGAASEERAAVEVRGSVRPLAVLTPSPEDLQADAQVKSFAAALGASESEEVNPRELQLRYMALLLDENLQAARAALARNPTSVEAKSVVASHLKRQKEILKALYVGDL